MGSETKTLEQTELAKQVELIDQNLKRLQGISSDLTILKNRLEDTSNLKCGSTEADTAEYPAGHLGNIKRSVTDSRDVIESIENKINTLLRLI